MSGKQGGQKSQLRCFLWKGKKNGAVGRGGNAGKEEVSGLLSFFAFVFNLHPLTENHKAP